MDTDLRGRTALVTGAGRGNGRAIARALAAEGADVIVNDLDEAAAESTVAAIRDDAGEAAGGNADGDRDGDGDGDRDRDRDGDDDHGDRDRDRDHGDGAAVAADVSDEDAVVAMVDAGREAFGPVDVLVNNAGVGDAGPFLERDDDGAFRLNLDVHLWGAIHCTTAVLDDMVARGYGKVVNVTSIHTKNGVGMSPEYDVGKFSLLGLTRSLALELGREGVRVNAVAPGWTETRMTEAFADRTRERIVELNPLGRFAEPGEVADAVTFLAAPASDYVNGHELRVDGGQVPIDAWKYDDR